MSLRVGVLVVSDRAFRGLRPDAGGPRLSRVIVDRGWRLAHLEVVPDETGPIRDAITRWSDEGCDLIVTTGGTGLAPRDVTPEATRPLLEKELPGVAEILRQESFKQTPLAALSRGVAGLRGRSFIVNLPGNPSGAEWGLRALLPLAPHVAALAAGRDPHSHAHA